MARLALFGCVVLVCVLPASPVAQPGIGGCPNLPAHGALRTALAAAQAQMNGGFGFTCGRRSSTATASCARSPFRARPRRPVAGQPRDLGAEGEHRERVQPAGLALSTANLLHARCSRAAACSGCRRATRSTPTPRTAATRRTTARRTIRWSASESAA